MRQAVFERQRGGDWDQLARMLNYGPHSASTDSVDLVTLYRRCCHDLALARTRNYSPLLIDRLDELVARAHQQLYRVRQPVAAQFTRYVAVEIPRAVRDHTSLMLVAGFLMLGLLGTVVVATYFVPNLPRMIVDTEQLNAITTTYESEAARLGRANASSDVAMFGFYVDNNTTLGLQTYAGGLVLGIGSVFYLLYNGLHLGAVAGHVNQTPAAAPFWEFVVSHSAPELLAAVLCGAAGMRLGLALWAPWPYRRRFALVVAGRKGLPLLVIAVVLFLLAAGIEAFWSANPNIPFTAKMTVGLGLWAVLLTYFSLGGRRAP